MKKVELCLCAVLIVCLCVEVIAQCGEAFL